MYDDFIDIKIFCMFTDQAPEKNNVLQEYIKQRFGINFINDGIPGTGEQDNRMNMWLASGEAPGDVVRHTGNILPVWELADANYIIELDDLFKEYPVITDAWNWRVADAMFRNPSDGKFYFIPACGFKAETMVIHDLGPVIREDFLKKAGVEKPKNLDELVDVLRAFKEIGQFAGINIAPFGNSNAFGYFMCIFGYDYDFGDRTFYNVNPKAYGEEWLYSNMLYREGLMDPEFFMLNGDQVYEKLMTGAIGYTMGYGIDPINIALGQIDPEAVFVGSPWPTGPNGFIPIRQDPRDGEYYHEVLVSSSFAKNEEGLRRLFEYLNWNYGEEGSFVTKYGPEGVYYALNSQGVYEAKPETLELQAMPDNAWGVKSGTWFYDIANMKEMDYKVLRGSEVAAECMFDIWWQNFRWERVDLVNWEVAQMEYRKSNGMTAQEHPMRPYRYRTDIAERYNQEKARAIMAPTEAECRSIMADYQAWVDSIDGLKDEIELYFDVYDKFMAVSPVR